MADTKTTVISVGANAELVRLRDYVLRDAGFNVVSTLHEQEALAGIERGECGVLVMCYSLPRDVRQRLAEALRSSCTGSRIVAITNERIETADFGDTFLYGVEGPEALIEAVKGAMSARA